ncbi:putative metal-binding protein [Carpediemonas membranifera]|uniref:Putative metal-binding protein n=1 Tax=Carpediemonas membranifera TaxID=201153 RepID=A0A8J6EB23_9EUKA|nr:putative metal-binding protein [Carpediemonas membranifera]|eukprot:KAG9396025.1 putative metal-binding protein [Carpediemonas membranifera]
MSIHGHEVMHMMLENPAGFTRETLQVAINARFGADARFHTCSAENMTASQLIDFLEARGKFSSVGEKFNTNPDRICKH